MHITRRLKSPLFTDWSEQSVKLTLPEVVAGTPLRLTINGQAADFQFTGVGSEVMVRLGLAKGEEKVLEFVPASTSTSCGWTT